MFSYVIFLLLVTSSLAEDDEETAANSDEIDLLWTCPQEPVTCLSSGAKNRCESNADCAVGAQCCYSGCVKKCIDPNPCSRVACEPGYLCQTKETPCNSPPCQLEGTCVPENEVLCKPLSCHSAECQPGFERLTGRNGCPTCQCVPKPDCGPTCAIFCAHGNVKDERGCPTCQCIDEPPNPCSAVLCASGQECRFVEDTTCDQAPCLPQAMCVPRLQTLYENSCSLTDATTVGFPVLASDRVTEVDCFSHGCPDNTVCTAMGRNLDRCCWQTSQKEVFPSPKAGECPQEFMVDYTNIRIKCQVDGQCPDDQKCCYKRLNVPSDKAHGYCMKPIHGVLENPQELCQRLPYLKLILNFYGYC